MLNENDIKQLITLMQLAQLAKAAENSTLLELINTETVNLWTARNSINIEPKVVKIHDAKFE